MDIFLVEAYVTYYENCKLTFGRIKISVNVPVVIISFSNFEALVNLKKSDGTMNINSPSLASKL